MKIKTLISSCLIFAGAFAFSVVGAQAPQGASLFLASDNGGVAAQGDTFTVTVRVSSVDTPINAAQGTVQFPTGILSVVSVFHTNSIFNVWLSEPTISSSTGTIAFLGGSTNAFTGNALPAFEITFRAKGSGTGTISFKDGAVTAGDGSGANVISDLKPLSITVGKQGVATPPIPIVAPPIQITRPAQPASGLPAKPQLDIPPYPNSDAWYNVSIPFFISWTLPADVSGVAAVVDSSPRTVPGTSEGLFESKQFPALEEGIWYAHVRFKNSVGWGPVANARIAVDVTPPTAFSMRVREGNPTDVPRPTLIFSSSDGLSGIDRYNIRVGSAEAFIATTTPVVLPVQAPGDHAVIVRAIDAAGNTTQSTFTLTISPLPSPTISPLTNIPVAGEGGMDVSGAGQVGTKILLTIRNVDTGQATANRVASVDEQGNWGARFNETIQAGTYSIEAIAKDSRGAVSLQVESPKFSVHERPLFTLGGIEILRNEFFAGLIFILLLGFAAGWFFVKFRLESEQRRAVVAQRDVITVFNLIKADLDKALRTLSTVKLEDKNKTEIEFILKGIEKNMEKMEPYVVSNIGEIAEEKVL
jgi:hypothetical protein